MTAPSSSAASVSPSRVKPTRSAKQTVDLLAALEPPRRELGGADRVVADLLAQVQVEHVAERLADQRRERLARPSANRSADVVLGVALAQERLGDQAAVRRRELRHRHPEQPGDLEHALLGQPGVEQRRDPLAPPPGRARCRRASSSSASGEPERAPLPREELESSPSRSATSSAV